MDHHLMEDLEGHLMEDLEDHHIIIHHRQDHMDIILLDMDLDLDIMMIEQLLDVA